MSAALLVYVFSTCLLTCVGYVAALCLVLRVRRFRDLKTAALDSWPKVSMVIPARNEQDSLPQAIASVKKLDYPNLEIVAVNDRSTDTTGAILDASAGDDPRLRVIHIQETPDDWLGKVHALNRGKNTASGEWILFADADVRFAPDLLQRALSACLLNNWDHLTLMPNLGATGLWHETALRTFTLGYLQSTGAASAGNPGSKATVGVGAFNLVRRSALEKAGGLEPIRMEIADDVGLGTLLQRSGAVSGFAVAFEDLKVRFYPSLRATFAGFEKNMFGACARYSILRLFMILLTCVLLTFGPPVALLCFWVPWLWVPGIVSYLPLLALAIAWRCRLKQPFLPSLLTPIGQLLIGLILLRSAAVCIRAGGVTWRDRNYSMKKLREGQTIRI